MRTHEFFLPFLKEQREDKTAANKILAVDSRDHNIEGIQNGRN